MSTNKPQWNTEKALSILQQYWKYPAFRGVQESVICDAILQQHQLVLMPTGGGKSICYQLPALYCNGLVLVVSPLISLMEDQVERLLHLGINAACLHSGCTETECHEALKLCMEGQMRVLYVSPERLQQHIFIMQLHYLKPILCVIDEAHCISQWGFDFRTSYLDVCVLRDIFPKVPVMALTATAGLEVLNDIQHILKLKAAQIKTQHFIRPLLKYHIRNVLPTPAYAKRWLDFAGSPGILYFRSRKKCELWNQQLLQLGLKSAFYHAGLSTSVRKQIQNEWMQNSITVLCATTAFGMGVDKANVRLVMHIDLPESPESYYQESGRAGRDQDVAYAVLCIQTHSLEQYKQYFKKRYPESQQLHTLLKHLYAYAHIPYGSGLLKCIEMSWDVFCRQYNLHVMEVQYGIAHLTRFGYIALEEGWNKGSQVMLKLPFSTMDTAVLNPVFKTIIRALLRLYPEIQQHLVRIQETQIAAICKTNSDNIKQYLNQLQKLDYLVYLPRQDKLFLTFLKPRADGDIWDWPQSLYENRKTQQYQRLCNMMLYLNEQHRCLQQYLLQLFSAPADTSCGNCMHCKRNAHIQLVKSIVIKQFELNKTQNFKYLREQLDVELEMYLPEYIQQLLASEYIKIVNAEGPLENLTFVLQRPWH